MNSPPSHLISCPNCNVPIGQVGDTGLLTARCATCNYRYRVVHGTVLGRVSRKTEGPLGTSRRFYEFRLALSGNAQEVVSFATTRLDDWIYVRVRHVLTVISIIRDSGASEVLQVVNHTSGDSFEVVNLREWKQVSGFLAVGSAGCASLVGLVVGAMTGVPFVAVALALLFAGLALFIVRENTKVATVEARQEDSFAHRQQQLLVAKRELLERRQEVERDLAEKMTLSSKITSLLHRMEDVGLDHYRSRAEMLTAGQRVLERQLPLERELLREYDRALVMVDIEIESGALTDGSFVDDAAERVTARLEELKAMREANHELQIQLEANEEVERLLRG